EIGVRGRGGRVRGDQREFRPGRASAPGAGDTDGGDGPGDEDQGSGGQGRGPPAARWPPRATRGGPLLGWGGDPPATPRAPLAPRAGPRPRPPVTGPWPRWSGGATPGTPPLARGSCDSVAGALAVPAGGATPSLARGCAGPGRLTLVMPGAASPAAETRPE